MRVYLDSCVVIYLIEGAADIRERISRRLILPGDARPTVVFTDLSRMECRVKPLAARNAATLADYDDFFETPGFVKMALDTAIFDLATELRGRHALKTPDAIHLAAAIASGCVELWSEDRRLAQAADPRINIVTIDQLV